MSDKNNRHNYAFKLNCGGVLPNRGQGWHYKLSPQSRSLAMDLTGQPHVDRVAMSARAVISTATIDRVGDMLIPQGCQLTNYDKNPVVLWAHGLEGIGQPIATSRGPDGTLGVVVSEDDVQATAWFSQSSLEAARVFELIDEGIVRATSVRETPLKSRLEHDAKWGEVLIVEEWDLEEWSWCAVGMNPDAVAKTLHRNRLGGQPIIASITKSLIAVAPTRVFDRQCAGEIGIVPPACCFGVKMADLGCLVDGVRNCRAFACSVGVCPVDDSSSKCRSVVNKDGRDADQCAWRRSWKVYGLVVCLQAAAGCWSPQPDHG